jgi:hypothetical protein
MLYLNWLIIFKKRTNMPQLNYTFDSSGMLPANLITDEIHIVSDINQNTYKTIIPKFAPFFMDNLVVKYVDMLNVETVLVEDVDYSLSLIYLAASRSIAKTVFGGITIINNYVNGMIKITYQTMGGSWVADSDYVLTKLAEMLYNPRIVVWDVVTNVQQTFPPIVHDQSLDYVYGYQDLITAINSLIPVITNAPSATAGLVTHLVDNNNPHDVTKAHVGLSDVENLPVATQPEINALSSVNKYVTLAQVIQVINAMRPL